MTEAMRIIVTTGRYDLTGVPLAQERLARALAARGHDVTFLIGALNNGFVLPEINSVKVCQLNAKRVSKMIPWFIWIFITEKPDVIFSAGDHLNSIVLISAILSFSKVKISCSSRVTPYDTYGRGWKGFLLKKLMPILMWRANALTCVAKDMVLQYRKLFRKSRHVAVYNIVRDAESFKRIGEPLTDDWVTESPFPVLVAAGSLVPWKGFHELLEAIALIIRHEKVRLVILGEGPERGRLEGLIGRLSIGEYVRLVGNVKNPLKYFSMGKVFVLSSHVEGMPNVLVEAMVSGCTPVAVNCPTGPRELLEPLESGYLVPMHDPKALAEGIRFAIRNPVSEEKLRSATVEFEEEYVIKKHFKLLALVSK